MHTFSKTVFIFSVMLFVSVMIFAVVPHSAQAVGGGACSLNRSPSGGPAPLDVTATYSGAAGGTPIIVYLDWGDGSPIFTDQSGGEPVTGSEVHTYQFQAIYTMSLECEGDNGYSAWRSRSVNVQSGGGPNPQCSDGIDNDGDLKIDYPADPGCTSPLGDNEAADQGGGTGPAWVFLDITTTPANMRWRLQCPGGSYSCDNMIGVGSQYITNCQNGQCAGIGTYTILDRGNAGYTCSGTSNTRPPRPPPDYIISLDLTCDPVATSNNAVCVSHTIPSSMTPGQIVPVSMTFQNTGTNTWTQLVPANYDVSLWPWPPSNPSVVPTGMDLSVASVAPGNSVTFNFNLTAPVTPGTYAGQYRLLEQGVEWFGATCGPANITVSAPANNNPIVSSVANTEPNYCATGPSGDTITWTYSDPDGDAQASFQVQVDDQSNFSSPVVDQTVNGAGTVYMVNSGLAYNVRYYARVRATDMRGGTSAWQTMTLCTGPGCAANQQSWLTPQHAYPSGVDFNWVPLNPVISQPVQFSTNPTCFGSGACLYGWTFGDRGSSNQQNPAHTYVFSGSYPVNLSITDDASYVCTANHTVTVNPLPTPTPLLPSWREVSPK